MTYQFHNLDGVTRESMLAEVDKDIEESCLYVSKRMTDAGADAYPTLLRTAVTRHDEDWLDSALSDPSYFKQSETREGILVSTPTNQVQTFAHGEFNRFYCRGLAKRAMDDGTEELEVYRARPSANPRPESDELVGGRFYPDVLLNDLRVRFGKETVFGIGGANSGLSLRIP